MNFVELYRLIDAMVPAGHSFCLDVAAWRHARSYSRDPHRTIEWVCSILGRDDERVERVTAGTPESLVEQLRDRFSSERSEERMASAGDIDANAIGAKPVERECSECETAIPPTGDTKCVGCLLKQDEARP